MHNFLKYNIRLLRIRFIALLEKFSGTADNFCKMSKNENVNTFSVLNRTMMGMDFHQTL